MSLIHRRRSHAAKGWCCLMVTQEGDARALLAEFGQVINLPSLSFDADGFCVIRFDDIELVIEHQPPAGELLLSTTVSKLPATADTQFYQILLELNHAHILRSPGAIGIDRTDGTILFLDRWPLAGLSLEPFQKRLRALLSAVKSWREIVTWAEQ